MNAAEYLQKCYRGRKEREFGMNAQFGGIKNPLKRGGLEGLDRTNNNKKQRAVFDTGD